MTSELRRSFKQKAKQALALPFRFRMGLEKLDSDVGEGGIHKCSEEFAVRSASFDLGYFAPMTTETEGECKISSKIQQVISSEDFVMICDQDKENKKKSKSFVQPKGTLPYTVTTTDTLPSIAAQFDTTTSELKKLNRLMSDMVFPGKVIYISDKEYIPSEPSSRSSSPDILIRCPEEVQVTESENADGQNKLTGHGSLKMPDFPDLLLMGMKPILSVARSSASVAVGDGSKQLDEDWHEQFIKLNVNHIIDGKEDELVAGVLLVTPNALMFESNPDDEHVIKNGSLVYDVIVPMSVIVGVTISHELAPTKPLKRHSSSNEDDVFYAKNETVVVESAKEVSVEKNADVKDDDRSRNLKNQTENLLDTTPTASEICIGQSEKNDANDDDDDDNANHESSTKADDETEMTTNEATSLKSRSEIMHCEMDAILSIESDPRRLESCPAIPDKPEAFTTDELSKNMNSMTAETTDKTENNESVVVLTATEVKCIQTDERKQHVCESTSGLDTPGKRCSALIGNIFRFQHDTTHPTSEKIGEKDGSGDGDPGKEAQEAECSTPTHRLMTRTLESLTSVSKPFVDLSSSLFSRNTSESRLKRDDERPESSSSPKLEKEAGQSQRVFFLRPLDLLTKRTRQSSSEEPELNITETEQKRASGSSETEPSSLFLCLKIAQFNDWSAMQNCPVASYIRTRLKPEYWFSIPSERVDHLYAFFLQWSPNIYGSAVNEINLAERGFVVINTLDGSTVAGSDDEWGRLTIPGTSGPAKEWEIINAKEVRRMINVAEIESLPLPELSEISKIMDESHIRQLCFHLPARAEGCPWHLVYSSDIHGFSLKTLYRRIARVDSPVLLVLKDDNNQVFGAMLPCALRMSDYFYGSGESYLFSFYQTFQKYSWTGHNNYFIRGTADSLSIGAGEGVYGLWLDGDLFHGRTQSCLTYNNDLLTVAEDFMVQCLEIWRFV